MQTEKQEVDNNVDSDLELISYIGDRLSKYLSFEGPKSLSNLYSLSHYKTLQEAMLHLSENPCHICIVEYDKYQDNQLHELHDLLKKGREFPVPIIVIGAKTANSQNHRIHNIIYLNEDVQTDHLTGLIKGLTYNNGLLTTSLSTTRKTWMVSNTIRCGEFSVVNLDEAQALAIFLGNQFPNKKIATMGIFELLLNSIEHGHLEIGFETKSRLVKENRWLKEVKNRLNELGGAKKVKVFFNQTSDKFIIRISDEGAGFDWKKYFLLDPSHCSRHVGRGIVFTKSYCFDGIEYNDTGTQVVVFSNKKDDFKW